MIRAWAPLLCTLAIALAAACGGGSTSDLGNGPADNVKGIWEGTYTGTDMAPSGTFCVNFQQDNRSLTGAIAFDSGPSTQLQGGIAEDRLTFAWGALAVPGTSLTTDITSGGTASGTVSAGALSGTFVITTTAGHGDWTGHVSDKQTCG